LTSSSIAGRACEKQLRYNLDQAQAMFLREHHATLHDAARNDRDRDRVFSGITEREMLRLDILRDLILDLVLDRGKHLPARLFRQTDLGQVNALLRNDDDQRIRVLRGHRGEIPRDRRLPVELDRRGAFIAARPAKILERFIDKLNQQAFH
jgi:hypothetical protein